MVFGDFVKQLIMNAYPHVWTAISFFVNFKFIMVIGIATFAFAMIYTFIPSARMKFIYQLPGALFSAIVWYVFSWLFSLYVSLPDTYSIYGSLATPVIMMFWLYFCIYIFLIGAFRVEFYSKRNKPDRCNQNRYAVSCHPNDMAYQFAASVYSLPLLWLFAPSLCARRQGFLTRHF